MSNFKRVLNILEGKKSNNITSKESSKISKEVRANMPKKSADKWDDPNTFIKTLTGEIEKLGYEIDDYSVTTALNKLKNRRQDIYIDVDTAQGSIEFSKDGKTGYVNVSFYNDPGKNHDTRYECNYYFN